MIEINLVDNATPMMKMIIENYPKATRSGLKSVGFKLRKFVQEGIDKGAPGGQRYARFFSPAVRYQMDKILGRNGKRRYPPMGRLKNAVAYGYQSSNSRGASVIVGWLSESAARRGKEQQDGFSRPLNEGMRRLINEAFDRAGYSARLSKSKHTLDTPARNTIPAAKKAAESLIPQWFEESFKYQLLNGKLNAPSSAVRKSYKVFT